MGRENAFGVDMPAIGEISRGERTREFRKEAVSGLLKRFSIPKRVCTADDLFDMASSSDLYSYENELDRVLADLDVLKVIDDRMDERLKFLYQQVRKAVAGHKVLDFGCGTGVIGNFLARERHDVTLADIYKDAVVDRTSLHFIQLAQNGVTFPYHEFDTTLLITVLHHCDSPIDVLKKARDATKLDGRVVVAEPVYGVTDASPFGLLSIEEQKEATVFLDHLYGRILHHFPGREWHSNPPNSFNTLQGWERVCEAVGLVRKEVTHLGINYQSGPYFLTFQTYEVMEPDNNFNGSERI